MSRFVTPILVGLLLNFCWAFQSLGQEEGKPVERIGPSKPNILLIYLDDMGWRDTGFMGSDYYETPHLDRLAVGGMVFSDAYSCAANCAPARASLMSGQYSPRHKIFNVGTGPRGKKVYRRLQHIPGVKTLDPRTKTFAHILQDAGYVTATMGKWHLSNDPLPYGFDVNIAGTHAGGPPNGYYPPHGKAPGLKDAPANEYITDRLSNEAIKFISTNKDNPWFLYLTHFAVHTPVQAKKELVEKYESKNPGKLHRNAKMATMIQAVDDGVGRIVAALERLNLDNKTIILFTSDNGGYGPATDMQPLKGYKGSYYEGGIRVPFFVYWPGVVKPGAKSGVPVIAVDFFPTLCEIAGVKKLPDLLDGKSLVPVFKSGKEQPDSEWVNRSLYWHFPAYLQSYRGVFDEQRDPLFRSRPCSVIRSGHWKLHHYYEDNGLELYNLKSDIGESRNLAESNPAKRDEMLKKLDDWRKSVKAPIPREPNPDYDAETEKAAIEERMGSTAGRSK